MRSAVIRACDRLTTVSVHSAGGSDGLHPLHIRPLTIGRLPRLVAVDKLGWATDC